MDEWVGGWWTIRTGSETWKELTPQVEQGMSGLKMKNIGRRDRRQKCPLPSLGLPHIHQGMCVNAQKAPQHAHSDPDSELPSQADQPAQGWWLRSRPLRSPAPLRPEARVRWGCGLVSPGYHRGKLLVQAFAGNSWQDSEKADLECPILANETAS